ncbi:MAG TPA: serine hydrolase domain-containing protein [Gaiellaceae bacterium]|nr:serine hydrolase domain-containing protein [Gaiellaceae bacterium]
MSATEVVGAAIVAEFEVVSEAGTDMLLQAGSISKAIAALTALTLVESGALDLDGDVDERLVAGDGVTLRRLLSHTAAINVDSYPGYPPDVEPPTFRQSLAGAPPAATPPVVVDGTPGAGWRYSGGGYTIVQALIEDATGRPFADVARELVLAPLGMDASTFVQHPGTHVYPEAAAAGLWSTPGDLARFVIAVQDALAGRSSPLREETARLMVTGVVELPPLEELSQLRSLGLQPPDRMGLGLFVGGEGAAAHFSHVGGAADSSSLLVGSLCDGSGAVVMAPGPFTPVLLAAAEIAAQRGWPGFGNS